MCLFSQQSCHFYSHCIESHFYCGPTGFTQAYAEARCERIDQLRNVDNPSCDHCISSSALYNWAVHQDSCLKRKLLDAVESDFKSARSDPPTCLQLEQRGLRFMEECSREQSATVCSSLAGNPAAFGRDIEKIARHFRVNSYYATQVERMLRNLVSTCGEEDHVTAIAESVLTEGFHSQRLVFCAVIFSSFQDIIDDPTAVQLVSQNLNRSVEQFTFSGVDHSRRCIRSYRYPQDISPTTNDQLIFITWTPEPNDPLIETIGTEKRKEEVDDEVYYDIVFYQYSPLRSSEDFPECGDGLRQAGELCDMGVRNTDTEEDNVTGCSFSCVPSLPSVECSTGQFALSECWGVSCGDGVRSAGEECDDGNWVSGDGCSSCRQDPDFSCTTSYNSTSVCTHVSATAQTTPYPPATTSPPSKLSTSVSSSLSQSSVSSASAPSTPPQWTSSKRLPNWLQLTSIGD